MIFIVNYNRLLEEIRRIALSASRNPDDISIIAVSKTHPVAVVQEAINSGIRIFGENRVQEAKAKIPALMGDFAFHLVGHLQSNKARDAVRLFDVIHSIDRLSTATEVDKEAARAGKVQKVLAQINTSGEASKSGALPGEAEALCGGIIRLPNIRLLGLMTIGPLTHEEARIRDSFRTLRGLLGDINTKLGLDLRELSMGMSADYAIAVEEGATMVRIGTAIFGERSGADESVR